MSTPLERNDLPSIGTIVPQGLRYLSATAIVTLLLLTLAGALTIPFAFEPR